MGYVPYIQIDPRDLRVLLWRLSTWNGSFAIYFDLDGLDKINKNSIADNLHAAAISIIYRLINQTKNSTVAV